MERYIIAFVAALAVSFITTPFIKKLALKIGAIDVPKDERRVHDKPIPRLGGLAIYIAFIGGLFSHWSPTVPKCSAYWRGTQ